MSLRKEREGEAKGNRSRNSKKSETLHPIFLNDYILFDARN